MLELDPKRIDLWFVFFDEIHDERLLERYRRLLTSEERSSQLRFHFARDRHRYLVTRALVRTMLSRYAPLEPEQWSFSKNTYGRPEISNADDTARKIVFNLSHTQSLIILGVTCGNALGVDTENVRIRPVSLDVADRFFAPDEVRALYRLPADSQHERFFHYWTLKESYIKARGMGLSIPLHQFGFDFPGDDRISIWIDPRLNDHPARWRFWQFRPSSDYLAAVCVERMDDGACPQLMMKKIVPLQSEEELDCALLRESQ